MNIEKAIYQLNWRLKQLTRKIEHSDKQEYYCGKQIIGATEANELIKDAIIKAKPFMAGRFGSSELNAIRTVNDRNDGFDYNPRKPLHTVCYYSGFFPENNTALLRFAKIMRESMHEVDLLGVWNLLFEDYEIKKNGNDPIFCRLDAIEPFFCDNPWTEALHNKKVLVIHPFSDSIKLQYSKRDKLFQNKNILPEFELITQKAVQTIADNKDSRFNSWFDALDYMYHEAMSVDFDVAIIGCGAYGFPLAARIKSAGKIAIHMGGVTQCLFGIRGKRWENNKRYSESGLINTNWIRPVERPDNYSNIENGCYW